MKKKSKPLEYAETFDRLMQARFNEKFETVWSILAGVCGGYKTFRASGKKLTKEMVHYGSGVSDGIAAAQAHYERRR